MFVLLLMLMLKSRAAYRTTGGIAARRALYFAAARVCVDAFAPGSSFVWSFSAVFMCDKRLFLIVTLIVLAAMARVFTSTALFCLFLLIFVVSVC